MHPCPFCHAPLPQSAPFCPTCGQAIQWVTPAPPPEPVAPAPPAARPPSILSRELQMHEEHPAHSAPPRGDEVSASFHIAHPLPSHEPGSDVGPFHASPSEPRVARVAPLWRRFAAWIIDSALLVAILGGFLGIASRVVHHAPSSRQSGLDWLAETVLAYSAVWIPAMALFALITVAYLALFTALGGQTPGKRALGLQVVDASGSEPSILRSGVRAVLALGSGLLVLMGFLLAIFDRRRQTLHDKLAHTFVVCQS